MGSVWTNQRPVMRPCDQSGPIRSHLDLLLDGWSAGCQEVVEIHHGVDPGVQEGTEPTLTSSNKPVI